MAISSRQLTKPPRPAPLLWPIVVVAATHWARQRGAQRLHDLSWPRWPRWLRVSVAGGQPWRLIVGALVVFLPAVLLSVVSPALPVTTPGVVLLVPVAFSAYVADWVGGATALVLASLILDLRFVGDRTFVSVPKDTAEAIGFAVTMVCGGALIWLIEHIKKEGDANRLAAVAARAAATALTSLDTIAASQTAGEAADPQVLLDAVLRSMVRINHAHAGELLLASSDGAHLLRAAIYGFGPTADNLPGRIDLGEGFIGLVARERRTLPVTDIRTDQRFTQSPLQRTGVRALLGVPLVGADDRLIGVAQIGLLVRHQFTPTEIAKFEALASRSAAIIETAEAVDERESLLRRTREAQRRLELVIAAMPEAVVLAAPPDGRIVAFNQAATALLGPIGDTGPDSDITGRIRLPDGQPAPPDEIPLLTALRHGSVTTSVELVVCQPGGGEIPVLASAAPVREPDGTIVAVVAVFRDIAVLKEANRIKDEFVSVVSHELRSPLTPIRGFVQLVAKDLAREGGHASHVHRLNSIAGHVDRMTRLVDDLLDVSRLKTGSLDIQPSRVDLVALCHDVLHTRSATATGHRLVFDCDYPAVIGEWDADRLHQVIDNLVGNAVKYSPVGGRVTLSLAIDRSAASAVLTVADEGPGIAPADRERVFSAFYRTHSATSSQIAGLGLGLYICHELVAAHGGTIALGDAAHGGAAFTVRLPLGAHRAAA